MNAFPRVKPVGDRAVVVELGDSLDETTVARVRAFDESVRGAAIAGVTETVPTYASLLAIYDRATVDFKSLAARLLDLARDFDIAGTEGRLHTIDAVYDGEDLPDVAAQTGLTVDDVVAIHSGRDYGVLMLGFSPGFAYQGFVDEKLRLPRRKTPRTRVPAGSIGIAGPQTGIYPRPLPGGWNLLGRTSVRLFDHDSSRPSTLMPGDRVRFNPVEVLASMPSEAPISYSGTGVRVVEPGILTTIQDGGRWGLRSVAVPSAGFADSVSAQVANVCVGNPPRAPLFEICGPGLKLRFDQPTFIALSGAQVDAELERADLDAGRQALAMNVAVRVRASNVLTIGGLSGGTRAYIAIAGLEAPRALGSSSVDVAAGLLRPVRAGDGFRLGVVDADRARREPARRMASRDEIRVVLGPQDDYFDTDEIQRFFETEWTTGLDSDRTGVRLDGARIRHMAKSEIVSDAMVPGCIQIPPDGRPIAMLADCPTTGGYPKIGCVISEDLGLLAQSVPGKTKFRFITVQPGSSG